MTPPASDLLAAVAGNLTPQKTLWTPRTPTGTTATTMSFTITVIPQVGDLMIMTWHGNRTATAFVGVTIGDTGSSGWTAFGAFQTRGTMTGQVWYKQATSADFNGGSGITVTIAQSGGSGTIASLAVSDLFTVSQTGYTVTGDLFTATNVGGTPVTISVSPGAGSSQTKTDELAYVSISSNSAPGNANGANTFTGTTTPTRNLTQLGNPSLILNTFRTYGGLCIPSSTAGNNVWTATWTSTVNIIVFAATFFWTA